MAKKARNYNRRYPNEYNIFRTLFYMAFLHVVVIPFMKIFYDYTITGKENLPTKHKSGKYIYTANHVSIFDPPMVTMATYRPIAYMAKKELFDDSEKLSWLVKRLGAFAVDRTKPEIATFKTVRDILATSWSLGVFPQAVQDLTVNWKILKKVLLLLQKTQKQTLFRSQLQTLAGILN